MSEVGKEWNFPKDRAAQTGSVTNEANPSSFGKSIAS